MSFDSQRYDALCAAATICEKQFPWVYDFPWELSEGRTKVQAVITYLCTQMHQMENDFAQLG